MEGCRTTHDWSGDVSLAGTVVEAVATASGTEPTELPPLNDVVDPDALERLFDPTRRPGRRDGRSRVEFPFGGHLVTVTAGGDVAVRDDAGAAGTGVVTDEEEFGAALERLVRAAAANGVDVDGGWSFRDDSDGRDWGVEVYEVQPSRRVG